MDKLLTNVDWNQMLEATGETLYMTAIAALATFVLGLILGLLLFMTAKDNLWENKSINTVIGAFVNIFRSIPFIILIIFINPIHKDSSWNNSWSKCSFAGFNYWSGTILRENG